MKLEKIYNFIDLKKAEKKQKEEGVSEKIKIAIMGDCATQHLSTAITGYSFLENLPLKTLDVDYNQIDAQLIDTSSEVFTFNPDILLLCFCVEKLYEKYTNTAIETRVNFADSIANSIEQYWNLFNSKSKGNILQFNFPEYDDFVFGNYACKVESSFLFQLRKLNYILQNRAISHKNVFIVDISSIQMLLGREKFYDQKLYYIAKMPFSLEALPLIAKNTVSIIKSLKGIFKKCLICDLDNTLWGGVIGDDGLDGIQIGELGLGHAYSALQSWIKELKNRGIIIGICSKNNEDTAKEPFEKHPDMILRLDDLSIFVANWNDKAENLKYIQKTLNIGMDSIVFIDDNPFERNLVKSLIPEIFVPELPEDPALYLSYLQSLNLFETVSFGSEDINRTKQYKAEINRIQTQQSFSNYDDYLKSLEMKASAKPFDDFQTPRIAQLTQRSNQFNLRTIRYNEADIASISRSKDYYTLYFTLKDKFGDHGLISVVILEKKGTDTLFVSEWLMSCRVLKRGMEEFIVNKVISLARENGYKFVEAEYIATPKNAMVKDIYEKLGFERFSDNYFKASVDNFKYNKSFIVEEL